MARFKLTTGEKWEYDYQGHKIVVCNGLDRCSLAVDGKIQDVHNGISLSTTLCGKVEGHAVKVSLGGFWNIRCDVFVNHEQLTLVKKSEY